MLFAELDRVQPIYDMLQNPYPELERESEEYLQRTKRDDVVLEAARRIFNRDRGSQTGVEGEDVGVRVGRRVSIREQDRFSVGGGGGGVGGDGWLLQRQRERERERERRRRERGSAETASAHGGTTASRAFGGSAHMYPDALSVVDGSAFAGRGESDSDGSFVSGSSQGWSESDDGGDSDYDEGDGRSVDGASTRRGQGPRLGGGGPFSSPLSPSPAGPSRGVEVLGEGSVRGGGGGWTRSVARSRGRGRRNRRRHGKSRGRGRSDRRHSLVHQSAVQSRAFQELATAGAFEPFDRRVDFLLPQSVREHLHRQQLHGGARRDLAEDLNALSAQYISWIEKRRLLPRSAQQLHVHQIGSGDEPVIMIHGLLSTSAFWIEGVCKHLSASALRKFCIFCPDLIGYGRSENVHSSTYYSMREQARRVWSDVVERFQLSHIHLVGHSFGGLVALQMAADHKERVKSVLLYSPAYFANPAEAASHINSLVFPVNQVVAAPNFARAMMRAWRALRETLGPLVESVIPASEIPAECIRDFLAGDADCATGTIRAIVSCPVEGALRTLREANIKVLSIHGEIDAIVPLSQGKVMAERYRNVELRVFEAGPHWFPTSQARVVAARMEQELFRYLSARRRRLPRAVLPLAAEDGLAVLGTSTGGTHLGVHRGM
uniref:AB hydrolase-1 domain-containing protein n=1 Tax=Chromera velia CCMP2878 TaxID=1169474 RepID=A0A0G4GFN4_9ALVE|eukprot:Cvel_4624.t1-p1 / transcript=Cvel_4624.t1 / gene=Cvel_4624 / organism=Chromera_velia_CCMP2878 / gene_product=2-hydroxymuconate semialdehyde hydrolase, putative / transcript_product=2-hydroxymuconate semialdehyde hydrolase, putative / location=Cvel_scaffold203:96403-100439(+) / protein_length=661 / sequence_SO=supercontig / SO=protein_coding / is_pseudo=false